MILGCSRMRDVEITHSTDQITLFRCLQNAFAYLGGVKKEILFDNLRTIVLKRNYPSSASDFHPAFIDFRDHYGFTARLCRPYQAKTKGKIEHAVHFVKYCFFQLISKRYEKVSTIFTSNKSFGEWGEIFQDQVIAATILDRILHHCTTLNIKGESYRMKDRKKHKSNPNLLD